MLLVFFKILVRQPNPLKFSGSYIYNRICSLCSQIRLHSSAKHCSLWVFISCTLTWVEIDLSLWLHHKLFTIILLYSIQPHPFACKHAVFCMLEVQAQALSSCSVLPTRVLHCLPLLSIGLQVGSASGKLWKTGAWEEGRSQGISPSPVCLRGWWWAHSSSCIFSAVTSIRHPPPWLSTFQTVLTMDAAPAKRPQLGPCHITSFLSLSLQRNASTFCCATLGYFTISCLASQLVTHLCKQLFFFKIPLSGKLRMVSAFVTNLSEIHGFIPFLGC